ncbi:hypothetical protein [Streptomyces sp. NPDC006459]|uniref:hypothetical protein n=1 Tax=Streptomyces sp. NPDC006459 TaxID=3154303 RepID=UPI0033B54502
MRAVGATVAGAGGGTRYRWRPDQHGAWAMPAVPLSPHPGWAHAELFAAWPVGCIAVFAWRGRERNSPAYRAGSVAHHTVAPAVAAPPDDPAPGLPGCGRAAP